MQTFFIMLAFGVFAGHRHSPSDPGAPGYGPPPHRHYETEVFLVLEGRYLYEVDGNLAAGDLVGVPSGAAHAFTKVSDLPSRQLVLMLPAMDAVGFFSGLGKLMAAGRPNMAALPAYGAPRGVERALIHATDDAVPSPK